mmetsp:Transcript_10496/g.27534  ORF Transcript_10496/g.27534 Transcript_10496/m.27534 type:complete len:248 (-) Transcript_10496:257-1000(-)
MGVGSVCIHVQCAEEEAHGSVRDDAVLCGESGGEVLQRAQGLVQLVQCFPEALLHRRERTAHPLGKLRVRTWQGRNHGAPLGCVLQGVAGRRGRDAKEAALPGKERPGQHHAIPRAARRARLRADKPLQTRRNPARPHRAPGLHRPRRTGDRGRDRDDDDEAPVRRSDAAAPKDVCRGADAGHREREEPRGVDQGVEGGVEPDSGVDAGLPREWAEKAGEGCDAQDEGRAGGGGGEVVGDGAARGWW